VTAEEAMRNVVLHAAGKLEATLVRNLDDNRYNHGYDLPADAVMAMAYAEGVLRLLASYLRIDAAASNGQADRSDGQRPPGPRPAGRPSDAPRDASGRYVKALDPP